MIGYPIQCHESWHSHWFWGGQQHLWGSCFLILSCFFTSSCFFILSLQIISTPTWSLCLCQCLMGDCGGDLWCPVWTRRAASMSWGLCTMHSWCCGVAGSGSHWQRCMESGGEGWRWVNGGGRRRRKEKERKGEKCTILQYQLPAFSVFLSLIQVLGVESGELMMVH